MPQQKGYQAFNEIIKFINKVFIIEIDNTIIKIDNTKIFAKPNGKHIIHIL